MNRSIKVTTVKRLPAISPLDVTRTRVTNVLARVGGKWRKEWF
ncbi:MULTISPECIES: hypothetical protein [Mesorhizobium]|nr:MULTISPECIES: hypothetical protein [Mesorhizobium]